MIAPNINTKEYSLEVHDNFIKVFDKRIDQVISLNDITQIMDEVEKHRKSEKILLLIVTGKNTILSDEARERITFLAKTKTYKVALIIHDLAQRVMGNFVIHLLNNRRTLQLFTNDKDALKWLLDN